MTKPDLVALAARLDVCASEPSRTPCQTLREAAQALRHLASQPSIYEAGQREAARRILDKISDLAAEIEVTTGRFDPSQWKIEVPVTDLQAVAAAISALPADGGEDANDIQSSDVEACRDCSEASQHHSGDLQPSTSEATPSTAGSVREALEPFAREADVFNDIPGIIKTHDNVELWQPGGDRRTKLTVGDLRRARVAYAALSAPVEAPVAVKPLEWRTVGKTDHVAETLFGNYEIWPHRATDIDGASVWRFGDKSGESAETLDAAKAAAQADYEQRIRSALIDTPRPLPSVEPTPNERFMPRMLILDDLHAVCVGGRWDGWKFYRHPDGQWVSLEKLKEDRLTLLGGSAR